MKNRLIYNILPLIFLLGAGLACNDPSTGAQVKLSWNSNLGEQQGFYVEESTDGSTFTQVLSVADGTNTATVTGVTAGKTYYFRVRGFNQAGDSPYTSVVTAVVPAAGS